MSRMWEAYNTPEPVEWPQVFDSAEDAPPPVIWPTAPRVRTVRAQAVGNAAPGTINPPGSSRCGARGRALSTSARGATTSRSTRCTTCLGWSTSRPSQCSRPLGPRRSPTGAWWRSASWPGGWSAGSMRSATGSSWASSRPRPSGWRATCAPGRRPRPRRSWPPPAASASCRNRVGQLPKPTSPCALGKPAPPSRCGAIEKRKQQVGRVRANPERGREHRRPPTR